MNEEFIKDLIRFKIDAAGKIIDHLPPNVSDRIRANARLIYESIGENIPEAGERAAKPPVSSDHLKKVKIE